jgi:CheY-like chemotaxis protein
MHLRLNERRVCHCLLVAGMDSFLSKPVRPNDVKVAIQAHLAAGKLVSPTSPLDAGSGDDQS